MISVKRRKCCNFVLALYLRILTICEHLVRISRVYKECFHSRGQHLCLFNETKEGKEFNSRRIFLVHQHGRLYVK